MKIFQIVVTELYLVYDSNNYQKLNRNKIGKTFDVVS